MDGPGIEVQLNSWVRFSRDHFYVVSQICAASYSYKKLTHKSWGSQGKYIIAWFSTTAEHTLKTAERKELPPFPFYLGEEKGIKSRPEI